MEKVLITGATSYLGQVLTIQHLERGDEVYILIRPSTNTAKIAPGLKTENVLVDDGAQKNLTEMMALCQPDVLHHLASFYVRELEAEQVAELVEAGLTFGIRLLEALRQAGQSPRIVNATSHTIFYNNISPTPLNLYAATKLAFETILNFYAEAERLVYCSLVLFDTYGPDDTRVKLMTAIHESLMQEKVLRLTDQDIALEMVHIEDAARAFIVAADLLKDDNMVKGKHFAISQGERILTSELIALFEELAGKTIEKQWGAFSLPDRKILEPWSGPVLPGWEPHIGIRQGVKEMIQLVNSQ